MVFNLVSTRTNGGTSTGITVLLEVIEVIPDRQYLIWRRVKPGRCGGHPRQEETSRLVIFLGSSGQLYHFWPTRL